MANVNPHGKKKVSAPVINADVFGVKRCCLWIHLLRNLGNPMDRLLILGEIWLRLIHRSIIISPTMIVSTDMDVAESLMKDPNIQSNPHKITNQAILPILK